MGKTIHQQLLAAGFKRRDDLVPDSVYREKYGYECFWLQYTIYSYKKTDISIEWWPHKPNEFELVGYHGDNVTFRNRFYDLYDVMTLIERFKNTATINQNTILDAPYIESDSVSCHQSDFRNYV